MKVLIKYHADIDKIEKIKIGDWIDLRAAQDTFIHKGSFELISLGISMKLPQGYEAQVAPRSSTFKNYGVIMTNSIGIIDNSYSGTNDIWRFPAFCLVGTHECGNGSWIRKNDRICQFRIVPKQPEVSFEEVDVLDETDRGGFGSTGVN